MTGNEFTEWMNHMGMNIIETARALGIGRNSVPRYQMEGAPRVVALACSALAMKLPAWPIAGK